MVIRKVMYTSCAIAAISAAAPAFAGTIQSVTIHSGNGGGSTDSLIHVLPLGTVGTAATPSFGPAALTATDFSNARNSTTMAGIISPISGWKTALTADPTAQWIHLGPAIDDAGDEPGGLFAIPFTVPAAWTDVSMTFDWLADNGLGGLNSTLTTVLTQGLYLNGNPLYGTTGTTATTYQNNFSPTVVPALATADRLITVNDTSDPGLDSYVSPGQDWLYVNLTNLWGPAGLDFTFTITGTASGSDLPEPASLGLLGLGAAGLLLRRRK